MEVLEHEDEGRAPGLSFDEPLRRGEQLIAVAFGGSAGADERGEARSDPGAVVSIDDRLERSRQLRKRGIGIVRLGDPRFLFDDLAERPQRDAAPVRQTAALAPCRAVGSAVAELAHQTCFPRSRLADDRDKLRDTAAGAFTGPLEE